MRTTSYDESQESDWLFRLVIPASIWALLFVFFAVVGWASEPEPTQIADAGVPAPMISDSSAGITGTSSAAVPSDIEVADPAVTELELLDPVGAGHTPGR